MGYIDVDMEWRARISSDPQVCGGQVCIKGTRVMVTVVLDCLAAGMTPAQIVEQYSSVRLEDVAAVLGYAAELARECTMVFDRPQS